MRLKFHILVGLTVCACLVAPTSVQSAALKKKALIIGVDGTMSEKLALARTPNLNALKAQGSFTDKAVTAPTTHSASCWSSMFTGVWMDKHGVTNGNNQFTGNRFSLYPNFFKRIEQTNSALNTVAYARWADVTNALVGVDEWQAFGSDASIVTATCNLLTNADPDVFFTILLDVDSFGHTSGENGWNLPGYITAIETADGRVGQIMNALTNRVTYTNEDWLVIILADHGQHDNTIERSRLTFHLAWGPSVPHGTLYPTPSIVDVCASVLTHIGIDIDPAWDLDARVEGLARPPLRYGTNLIFNGDAEFNSGTNNYKPDRGIAWWWDYSGATLATYGANANFLSPSTPGPANRGNNYFLGGTNGNTFVSQTIDISELAGDIDAPGVDYQLSGWLGGAGSRSNSTLFRVRFLDSTNGLGANSIGPVTTTNRSSVSGLLECSTNGTLPAGARLVEFTLTTTADSATNDAAADNLSFVLTPRPDPSFNLVSFGFTDELWQVEVDSRSNRLYTLQYSHDLTNWFSLAPAIAGTGAQLSLSDPTPPTETTYYRVRCERP